MKALKIGDVIKYVGGTKIITLTKENLVEYITKYRFHPKKFEIIKLADRDLQKVRVANHGCELYPINSFWTVDKSDRYRVQERFCDYINPEWLEEINDEK